MTIYIDRLKNMRGTQNVSRTSHFLTATLTPYVLMNSADALQISWKSYFSNLLRMSERRTPSALAILAQVKIVGTRLPDSIKLIAGRLTPTFLASVSCDSSCSLRRRANSSTTFSINCSDALSLIKKIIADLIPI